MENEIWKEKTRELEIKIATELTDMFRLKRRAAVPDNTIIDMSFEQKKGSYVITVIFIKSINDANFAKIRILLRRKNVRPISIKFEFSLEEKDEILTKIKTIKKEVELKSLFIN